MLVNLVLEFNHITVLLLENGRNQNSYKGNKEGIEAQKEETKKEKNGVQGLPLSTAENSLPKERNKHKWWSNRSPYFSHPFSTNITFIG